MRCPLCDAMDTEEFLARDNVPVHQNVLFETREEARGITRGQLRMTVCRSCGFVFNRTFEPSKMTYQRGYDNDQTFSSYFDRYVASLVARLATDVGIDGKTIAEIGCGTGYFLERVVAAGAGSRGIGYDPSYVGELTTSDGRIRFVQNVFSREKSDTAADLVICRHVIEHLPQPEELVCGLRRDLPDNGTVVFETPSVAWILGNGVVWDFFYEHCSLFSAESVRRLFERCGFHAVRVAEVFDGQYLWLTAHAEGADSRSDGGVADLVSDCRRFSALESEMLSRWCESVAAARHRGGVAVWGAGAKGSTFVNLVDPEHRMVDCVVDVNPRKQNRFMAGTGHAVVSPVELRKRGVATVIIMNPTTRRKSGRLRLRPGQSWSLSSHDGVRFMKVVILAGGLGTRLSEETDLRPKPMIEIGGKPILWHIMKIYSRHGINDFVDLPRLQGLRHQGVFRELLPAHVRRHVRPARTTAWRSTRTTSEPWRVTLVDTGDDDA